MLPQTLSWSGAIPIGMGRRNNKILRAFPEYLMLALWQGTDLCFSCTEKREEMFGVSHLKECSKE